MKLRAIKTIKVNGTHIVAGSEFDVGKDLAKELIDAGLGEDAENSPAPAPKDKPAPNSIQKAKKEKEK